MNRECLSASPPCWPPPPWRWRPSRPGRGPQEEEKVLNVYNWSDYIAEDTLKNFEKETGIKVRYDNFDNNEILHAKLVAGKTGYDIVVPVVALGQAADRRRPAAQARQGPDPEPEEPGPGGAEAAGQDGPGQRVHGELAVGLHHGGHQRRQGQGRAGQHADAGQPLGPGLQARVHQQAQGLRRLLPGLGHRGVPVACTTWASPRSARTRGLHRRGALLKSVRPHVTLFSSSGYINDMANGSICLALGWSGDINIARQRAIDGKTGQNIQALMPKTGGLLFFDVMVIPADAPRPGNAHKFINYILRPEVHAGLTNKVFYANPNAESKKFVKPEVAANPTVFLSPADWPRWCRPTR
jgi:putrescine transport system substrate-binding protein